MRIKKNSLLASIDIGSNTLRLLLAEVKADGGIRELYSESRITRLGEGLSKSGPLNPKAMARSIEVLRIFKEAADRYPIERLRAVATSAVRRASNKKEFLSLAKKEAGLEVDVLTGREEARLMLLGVLAGINEKPSYSLVIDIGGGSTEVIFAEGIRAKVTLSTNFGLVPLAETFIKNDPVEEKDMRKLRMAVKEWIEEVRGQIKKSLPRKRGRHAAELFPEGTRLIGTAGTITTLAAIDQGLERYSFFKVNNYTMKKSSVEKMVSRLKAMTLEERRGIPALELGREDLILPGSLILLETMRHFSFKEILVSDYGLREGILVDLKKRLSKN